MNQTDTAVLDAEVDAPEAPAAATDAPEDADLDLVADLDEAGDEAPAEPEPDPTPWIDTDEGKVWKAEYKRSLLTNVTDKVQRALDGDDTAKADLSAPERKLYRSLAARQEAARTPSPAEQAQDLAYIASTYDDMVSASSWEVGERMRKPEWVAWMHEMNLRRLRYGLPDTATGAQLAAAMAQEIAQDRVTKAATQPQTFDLDATYDELAQEADWKLLSAADRVALDPDQFRDQEPRAAFKAMQREYVRRVEAAKGRAAGTPPAAPPRPGVKAPPLASGRAPTSVDYERARDAYNANKEDPIARRNYAIARKAIGLGG